MVWATWVAKSASVRVGPMLGAITWPVATSKLAIRHWVPWRAYSNSCRSILPGRSTSGGCSRSKACIPLFSSVLTVRTPAVWRAGAASYVAQTFRTVASNPSGSAARSLVNQYPVRCGLSWASCVKNARPCGPRCGGRCPAGPLRRLTRRASSGSPAAPTWPGLAGQRQQLADLLGAKGGGSPGPGRVVQLRYDELGQGRVVAPVGLGGRQARPGCQPAGSPDLHGLPREAEPLGELLVVPAVARGENNPHAAHQPVRARGAAGQAL